MTARQSTVVLALLLAPTLGQAQTYNLSETPKTGEFFRHAVSTSLQGTIKVVQDGKENRIKLSAKNEHVILEKVLRVEDGLIRKSVRHYEKAASHVEVGEEKTDRGLRDDRRLMVAQRTAAGFTCYSPAGPLTRTELEVASEHFDTHCLSGLLPQKEVVIEDSWRISNAAAQGLCLFEGLVSHDLAARLKEVKDGHAVIVISGKASGIELGAAVRLEVQATVRFDILRRRIAEIEWTQKDSRDPGPASPAAEVESTTRLTRSFMTDEPVELNKVALASVPAEDEPRELLKHIVSKEPGGRYTLLHGRDWHVVGQTDTHTVLRLIERGDFIAQATIAIWKKAEPGKHAGPDEFKRVIGESPGWEMEEIIDSGEIPTDEGRWIYRVTARGELDGAKVIQNFALVAGPRGDQVVVTFTMKPGNFAKIGTRDVALVNSIQFVEKK